jgi:hypothetical protein
MTTKPPDDDDNLPRAGDGALAELQEIARRLHDTALNAVVRRVLARCEAAEATVDRQTRQITALTRKLNEAASRAPIRPFNQPER